MKLSEFVMTRVIGTNALNWEYFAQVTVTTGILWMKRSRRVNIYRKFAEPWIFVATGKFTPGCQAEELERAYRAQEKISNG